MNPATVARALLAGAVRSVAVSIVYLYVWTVLPLAIGWTPSVVMTGSMEPAISPGDVVLTAPVPTGAEARVGDVLRFTDPADPARSLVHRVAMVNADGTYTTKGDANPEADSTPVPPSAVGGQARLSVPMLGLPVVWLRTGRYGPLIATLLAVTILFGTAISYRPVAAPAGPAPAEEPPVVLPPPREVLPPPVPRPEIRPPADRFAVLLVVATVATGVAVGLAGQAARRRLHRMVEPF